LLEYLGKKEREGRLNVYLKEGFGDRIWDSKKERRLFLFDWLGRKRKRMISGGKRISHYKRERGEGRFVRRLRA